MRMPMAQMDPSPTATDQPFLIYWINQELEMMPLKRQTEVNPSM